MADHRVAIYEVTREFSHHLWLCEEHAEARQRDPHTTIKKTGHPVDPDFGCDDCANGRPK